MFMPAMKQDQPFVGRFRWDPGAIEQLRTVPSSESVFCHGESASPKTMLSQAAQPHSLQQRARRSRSTFAQCDHRISKLSGNRTDFDLVRAALPVIARGADDRSS